MTAAWKVCVGITVNAAIESFSLVLVVSFRSEFFDPSPGRVRSYTTAELSSVLKVSSVWPGLGMPGPCGSDVRVTRTWDNFPCPSSDPLPSGVKVVPVSIERLAEDKGGEVNVFVAKKSIENKIYGLCNGMSILLLQ